MIEVLVAIFLYVAIKLRHDVIPQTKRPNITVGMLSATNYDEPAYLRNKK